MRVGVQRRVGNLWGLGYRVGELIRNAGRLFRIESIVAKPSTVMLHRIWELCRVLGSPPAVHTLHCRCPNEYIVILIIWSIGE